jgi:hypothetical protein
VARTTLLCPSAAAPLVARRGRPALRLRKRRWGTSSQQHSSSLMRPPACLRPGPPPPLQELLDLFDIIRVMQVCIALLAAQATGAPCSPPACPPACPILAGA